MAEEEQESTLGKFAEIVNQSYENMRRKREEWQRKVKRASKLVKKYQCQVRYYEKKMVANNEKKGGG
jgi:hypothetical protein